MASNNSDSAVTTKDVRAPPNFDYQHIIRMDRMTLASLSYGLARTMARMDLEAKRFVQWIGSGECNASNFKGVALNFLNKFETALTQDSPEQGIVKYLYKINNNVSNNESEEEYDMELSRVGKDKDPLQQEIENLDAKLNTLTLDGATFSKSTATTTTAVTTATTTQSAITLETAQQQGQDEAPGQQQLQQQQLQQQQLQQQRDALKRCQAVIQQLQQRAQASGSDPPGCRQATSTLTAQHRQVSATQQQDDQHSYQNYNNFLNNFNNFLNGLNFNNNLNF